VNYQILDGKTRLKLIPQLGIHWLYQGEKCDSLQFKGRICPRAVVLKWKVPLALPFIGQAFRFFRRLVDLKPFHVYRFVWRGRAGLFTRSAPDAEVFFYIRNAQVVFELYQKYRL
jgi:hypothetical protein